MKLKKVIRVIVCFFILLLSAFIISLTYHLNRYYTSTYFEQLLYNLLNTTTLKLSSLKKAYVEIPLMMLIIINVLFLPLVIRFDVRINLFEKKRKIFPVNLVKYSIFILVFAIIIGCIQIKVGSYVMHTLFKTKLYDNYYVSYDKDKVSFEGKKKNLIHIYVESLENSNFSYDNGGISKKSYMPNLEKLSMEYINFSNNDKIGGFKNVNGTNWTVAGMVSQTAGVPIYTKAVSNNKFLSGATSMGDILLENGYNNYLLIGSDAKFEEREEYFKEHGSYYIFDYNYALNNRLIPSNYYVWWGYEDRLLFQFAKNNLLNISKRDKPFNFTILTVDTHFYEGYVDNSCPNKFKDHLANSFYCEDIMLYDFIKWIQEQDFYKDTTIVITGDHLLMREDFYDADDYTRTVYNLFINSAIDTDNTKNRDFTAFDIFPTTLSSIGATIEGERLGLGTNLFSDKKTISEEIGYKKFAKEIAKQSNYYNKNILK